MPRTDIEVRGEGSAIVGNVAPEESLLVRLALPDDAEDLLLLRRSLDEETEFMMLEPGERTDTCADVRRKLSSLADKKNSALWVVENEGHLIGYLSATGGEFRRNSHVASVVIGILNSFAGRGLGQRLFEHLDAWAPSAGVTRLDLTVMVHNKRAIALYRKMGFVSEGRRRNSLRVNDKYVDEYQMAKLLS